MKELILLSAIPGAGKSTWANEYIKNHKNSFIISSDEIRKELGGSYQYFKEENKVWSLFLSRANDLAEKYDDVCVIMDSTLLDDDYRKMYLDATPSFDKHTLIYFDISFDLACKRNVERKEDKVVPQYAMDSLYRKFIKPSDDLIQLFDSYIVISED